MKKKISIVGSSDSVTGGGWVGCKSLEKTLCHVGFDAKLVKWKDIGSPDIVLFNCIGMNGEKDKENNRKRLEKIISYYCKIPMVVIINDILEQKTFKDSYFVLGSLDWSAIISVEPSQRFMDYVKRAYPNGKIYAGIRHPWEFKEEQFEDRSSFKNVIANTARFAGTKRSDIILEIASRLRKKKFILASREKGVYWYRKIKDHPLRKHATFYGEAGYKHHYDVLKGAGFMIDLTYFWTKEGISGQRTQFTSLEAINCGCIPINFENWRWKDGYEGVWLPEPKKEGGRFAYKIDEYVEIIKRAKYDFELAKYNYNQMKKTQDYKVIGKELKRLFDNLTI